MFEKQRRWPVFYWVLIGFLVGMILPVVLSAMSIRTQPKTALSEMRNLAICVESYKIDYGSYPKGKPFCGDLSSAAVFSPTYLTSVPTQPDYAVPLVVEAIRPWARNLFLIVAFISLCLWSILFYRQARSKSSKLWHGIVLWVIGTPVSATFQYQYYGYPSPALFITPVLVAAIFALIWTFANSSACPESTYRFDRRDLLVAVIMPYLLILSAGMYQGTKHLAHRKADEILPAGLSYRYITDGNLRFLLQSYGPDCEYDLAEDAPLIQSLMSGQDIALSLAPYEYDPTNGTFSNGDVFRSGP